MNRRGFLFGIGATIAVVPSGILMPIKSVIIPERVNHLLPAEYIARLANMHNKLLHHALNYQMGPRKSSELIPCVSA